MKRILAWLVGAMLLLGVASSVDCVTEPIDSNTVMTYGTISLHDGLNLRKHTKDLKKGDTIRILLNSAGGMTDQMQDMIYCIRELKERGVHIVTEVTGEACSAAAVLWAMGDERVIHEHSILMFHKAWLSDQWGNPIKEEDWDEGAKLNIDMANAMMTAVLVEQFGVEMANYLVQENDIWLTGAAVHKLGLSTKLLK